MTAKIPLDEIFIDELLIRALDNGCNELFLDVGVPPRACGNLGRHILTLDEYEDARPLHIWRIICDVLTDEEVAYLESGNALLTTYHAEFGVSFGVFAVKTRRGFAAAYRAVLDD